MASTQQHIENALRYLKYDEPTLSMAIIELENALDHYKIEKEMETLNEDRNGLGSMVS